MNNYKLVMLFLALAFISSCSKEEPAVESLLIGTWNGDEFYEDGVISDMNAIFKGFTSEFLADGTGEDITFMGPQPFTWSYDASTEKLTIITEEVILDEIFSIAADTVVANITKLDDTSLWYTHDDDGVAIEERYLKSN